MLRNCLKERNINPRHIMYNLNPGKPIYIF